MQGINDYVPTVLWPKKRLQKPGKSQASVSRTATTTVDARDVIFARNDRSKEERWSYMGEACVSLYMQAGFDAGALIQGDANLVCELPEALTLFV